MAIFRIPTLADLLFGQLPKNKMVGLEIFTRNTPLPSGVFLKVAPQNIQFAQRSRISEQIIKDGRAFFFWKKDRNSRHLDLLEIRLSGITSGLQKRTPIIGKVLSDVAKRVIDSGIEITGLPPQASPSLTFNSEGESNPTQWQQHWLRLWQLTREPFVDKNRLNPHSIAMKTPALPSRIQFDGHFSQPLQWEENADNPFLVNWSITLIVHRTQPDLDQYFEQNIRAILEP